MYSIRLEGDAQALLKSMQVVAALDKKKINADMAQSVRTSTLDRFKNSISPEGTRWETSIRAGNEGGKTLIQTSQLRNSISVKSDATGFTIGTNVKYAATHQFGASGRTIRARKASNLRFKVNGKWISKNKVTVDIPARPFLGLSDEDMKEIKQITEEHIAGGK